MSVFGPHYTAPLQPVIDHAERFAAILSEQENGNPPSDDDARAWLTGRSEEVEMAVALIVADWRAGQLTEGAAVSAIASYLRGMHVGAERHLSAGPMLECCAGDAAVTVPLTPHDQRAEHGSVPAGPSADTLVGPGPLLVDSYDEPGR